MFRFDYLESLIKSRGQSVAEQLRLSGSKVAQLRRDGLTHVEADRYACRVGAMPFEIWPGWYSDDPIEFDWDLDEAPVGVDGQTVLPLIAA